MKTNELVINTILRINLLVVKNHIRGNTKTKRFYQLLMNWLIAKQIK
jgi:hypothetical protein